MPKCLIADSSRMIRTLLSKTMKNFAFDTIEAESGDDVYELCLSESPDLIILDYNLPILDGIDVLYKIRGNNEMKQPKIFFCSSSDEVAKLKLSVQGGADDYIMRPFDEDIIASKLAIINFL